MENYRYENQRKTKEEMDFRHGRRYANNGNKTVAKAMKRKSRMEENR